MHVCSTTNILATEQHGCADDSEEGDFFYDEEEVLNGIGAENRAALLDRYDAMLDDAEQPDPQEVTAFSGLHSLGQCTMMFTCA